MAVVEEIKRVAERVTGRGRPSPDQRADSVRARKAHLFRFEDDGIIPNHPRWPLILYRGAVRFDDGLDPAAVLEDLFGANGWGDSWRNGIYDYVHYHARIHEVLGIARGRATVQFGGLKGRKLTLKAGDVAILPAGTGHHCLDASKDFLVVGAYPPQGTYDECTRSEDHARASRTIPRVPRPRKDPLYGTQGPLLTAWRRPRREA
ncbi:cupin [Afipia sp. P52-10]|uniref:cupin n=1 Tax=Afipia sp. P52-10 TaxID=1429916 RepID=UPI0003DF4419|nr:cupin [Afipia sp. P52-10]ETR75198.1 cupin [Afipia sp. P52-10]